jgi:hypothetical protein
VSKSVTEKTTTIAKVWSAFLNHTAKPTPVRRESPCAQQLFRHSMSCWMRRPVARVPSMEARLMEQAIRTISREKAVKYPNIIHQETVE